MNDLQASAARVGIKINLTTHPYASVVSAAGPCTSTEASCKWTAEYWGGGWTYGPDFLPTGEELFQTGAAANYGSYYRHHRQQADHSYGHQGERAVAKCAQRLPGLHRPAVAGDIHARVRRRPDPGVPGCRFEQARRLCGERVPGHDSPVLVPQVSRASCEVVNRTRPGR